MHARGVRAVAHRVRTAGGLTVFELLVCLAVGGILAGLAAPQFAEMRADWELRTAGLRVVGELIRARASAPGARGGSAVRVEEGGLSVRAGVMHRRVALPAGVDISLNSGGDVRFSPHGLAENATFRLRNRAGERLVVVNQRGRIQVR